MGKITWFKLFGRNEAIFSASSDEAVGRAIKAAFRYLNTGEVPELDECSNILFAALRRDIDQCAEEYLSTCEKNRTNIQKRWDKNKPNSQNGGSVEDQRKRSMDMLENNMLNSV